MFLREHSFDTSDQSGTPGSCTINKPSGTFAFAAGASSVTVTNSLAKTTSKVILIPRSRDATGLDPLVTTYSNGSFIATTSANTTGILVVDFILVN